MGWPFKTIKAKSSWPFQPRLIALASEIMSVPKAARHDAAGKTIERTLRMAARLANEFGIEACVFMDIAQEQLLRECPGAKAHLDGHLARGADEMTEAVVNSDSLVDGWLADAAKGGKPN